MGVFQDIHLPLNSYKLNIDDSKRNLVTSGVVCALFGPRQTPFRASKIRSPPVPIWCFRGDSHVNFLLCHH
jgi:hypothetical protein